MSIIFRCPSSLARCLYFASSLIFLILLPEKFLPFDWLRAEVFQLNLKYLHVKNYSYYGNPKSPNNLVAQVTQKWRKDFEILKSGNSSTKRKFGKPKY